MKIDKLIKKELNFQKDILNLKGNNSKLYYNSFAKEIYTAGKDKEEERNQDYMILNEKIEQKVLNYAERIKHSKSRKINYSTNTFKKLLKENKEKEKQNMIEIEEEDEKEEKTDKKDKKKKIEKDEDYEENEEDNENEEDDISDNNENEKDNKNKRKGK